MGVANFPRVYRSGLASLLPTLSSSRIFNPLMALSNIMFLWLVLGTAAGFHVLPGRPSTLILSLQSENSEAFPFLKRPEKLDGAKSGFVKSRAVASLNSKDLGKMIGDVGFDPLGLSEVQVDLNYARGAEVKHGRIAMLVHSGVLSSFLVLLMETLRCIGDCRIRRARICASSRRRVSESTPAQCPVSMEALFIQ